MEKSLADQTGVEPKQRWRRLSGARGGLVALGALFLGAAPVDAEQWVSIGPFGTQLVNNDVISGQLNAVAVHPRSTKILYVGSSEGGVWKTVDGGISWNAVTDFSLVRTTSNGKKRGTLSIGAVAVDPEQPETVYAGTGDPNVACCFVGPGLGVFRSTDGGGSWTPTGQSLTQSQCQNEPMSRSIVYRVLVIPGPVRRIYAATNMGVFRYDEPADCWTWQLNGAPVAAATDLVEDPFTDHLYAAFWGRGIFKLADPSGSWQMLGGGLPTTGFRRIALAFSGRRSMSFARTQTLYAGFSDNAGYRLFVSTDGGATFVERQSPPSDGQLDFNNVLAVGLYDPEEVYVGQIAFWRSLDGGQLGGKNNYAVSPPVESNSWTVLGCCLSHANPFRRNLDLHGDIHDIVFAPWGSFAPGPRQRQIVYVATDGGLTRGIIDAEGVVSWFPLTMGLAIGQAGTIGLDPNMQSLTIGGYWHNGDILTLNQQPSQSLPIIGGDGFQATFDAGSFTSYINCNAGFGGSICRVLPPAPFFTNFGVETIWSDNSAVAHWSDPHRPGNLLRLQGGLIFRTTVANSATPATLNASGTWTTVDPGTGKTGATTTVAFRSRLLEEQPVYYLGTTTGQVWRGGPETPWTKLCECGRKVTAIAPDLFQNERVFVTLDSAVSPGRIKQLTRTRLGTWSVQNIDDAFAPELDVQKIFSMVVDPKATGAAGTTVYIGTDQGIYRGRSAPLVVGPSPFMAHLIVPSAFDQQWTWHRSPGMPAVAVPDLEVHQNFPSADASGVLRAGTYGRGIYELDRTRRPRPFDVPLFALQVYALRLHDDGAPSYLNVPIPIEINGRKERRGTPFEIAPKKGMKISLEAPPTYKTDDALLKFVGWAVPGRPTRPGTKVTITADSALRALAYYEKEKRILDPGAAPPKVVTEATVERICRQGLTHMVTLAWDVTEGQRPLKVLARLTLPSGVQELELKHFRGTQEFPVSTRAGGMISAQVIATGADGAQGRATSNVRLAACSGDER